MKYRRIGATELNLSEIAFGCGGNAGLMVRGDHKLQVRIVARAIELGINYFDNSPDYGNGAAETNLGRVLKELGQRPLLNSKVEIRAENLDDIAGHVVRSCEESLRRLGVECIDIFQIHNGPAPVPPPLEGKIYTQLWIEDYMRPGGAIDGLLRLKRAGKIRHLGFICRGNDADCVRQVLDTGMFSLINVPYTLLNPTAGRVKPDGLQADSDFGNVIAEAAARGAGSAIYAPLASGYLSDDAMAGLSRHPLARQYDMASAGSQRNIAKGRAVRFLAQENGISLAQAAFRFILDHPAVTTALGGFTTEEQLEEIAAVPDLPGFSAVQMARLENVWSSNFGL